MKNQYTTKVTTINYSRTLVFLAFLLLISVCNSYSQVRVPFAPRTASATPATSIYTVKGDFTMVGNTNLTLQNYSTTANNAADMRYVDIDSDTNNNGIIDNDETANDTWNSSSATLTFSEENGAIPECSNIIYAGLYWTGRAGVDEIFTVTNGNETKEFDKRKVKLKKAGGVYQDVIATTTIVPNNNIYFPSDSDGDMYSAYAEVTDYVAANGLGEYFVADIATLEGDGGNIGYYGGWGMVVVYENSKMNWRDVTVFDGHAYVQREGGVTNYTFDIDGFKTAENGYINIKLGVMAGEGDVGVPGDTFGILNRTTNLYDSLSHSGNTATNFFDSSINTGLNPRNPTLANNTGVDIAMFDIDNGSNVVTDPDYNKYITNEQTSTSFQYGTSQDTYVIFNVTFSVDAYIPETEIIVANTSTNTSLDPGESADFTIEIKNTGTEATTNTTLNIPIPLSVDPSNLTFSGSVNPPYDPLDNYSAPTITPPVPNVNNGSIVWNMGTLPLPNNPDDVIAELTFSYTVTTDCSILSDPDFDEFVTLLGTISGTGETSGTDFEFNLIQGYETDGLCIGEPIIAPIEIPINVTDYVNEAPTITAPNTLDINGCDENDITASSARYPYSATESVDIKDTYEDVTGYTASDNGTIVSITYIDEIISNTTCPLEITRIFTATDDCGKTATAEQIISVLDTTGPIISAPADVTIECTEPTDPSNTGTATGSDTCSNVTISFSDSSTQTSDGSCTDYTYTITRTWTATDACGNSIPAEQTITVQDTTGPEITCPLNISVTNDTGQNYATVSVPLPTDLNDNCGTVTFSNDYTNGEDASGTYNLGTTTVTYTATDDCGKESTCSFTVTVNDEEAPALTCPPSIPVSCSNLIPAAYLTYIEFEAAGGSASDNDLINYLSFKLESESSDNNTCPETIFRVYSISDIAGNTSECTQTIVVNDEIEPTIDTEASDLTVECDGAGNTSDLNTWLANNGGATASDTCGGVTWSNNFTTLSDDCGATGAATVTFRATDDCGNFSESTATFTIEDTINPTIDTPASNETVECDGAGNTSDLNTWLANNGGATASDTCGGVTWSNNFTTLSDDCGATGAATVTFRATDDCGNFSESTATFTIEDTINLTIDTPASNETVECDGAGNTSDLNTWLANNGGATASDTCGGVTWSNNFTTLSDDCGATGAATVTFRATDDCGNFSESTATFTIEDTINPTIDTPASNETVECDGAGNTAELNAWLASNGNTGAASDVCSGITWSNDFTALSDDCGATGSATVTFTATDACGNASSTTATFTIEDTTVPTIDAAASDETVECDGAGNTSDLNTWLANNGGATASDTCGGVTWSNNFTTLSDDCGATGAATVTFRATDDCGNFSESTATFTIEDTINPTIDTPASNETVECDGAGNTAELNAWLASNGNTGAASDVCSGITWSNDFTALSDDCGATGSATVTFTATDACGNASSTTATFTIEDTINPTIDTPASNETVECDGAGNTAELNAWLANNGGATASDTCGGVTWSNNFTTLSDDCGATGAATVTFRATDDCGNFSESTATFTIEDTINPTIDTPASNETVECDGAGNTAELNAWLANNGGATASDTCGGVTWSNNFTTLSDDCGATGAATVTFRATDDCGNFSESTATFTIEDTINPTIDTPASNETVECDGAGNTSDLNTWLANNGGATASDTCGGVTWSNNFTTLSDDCGATGAATVTFRATDDCGNFSESTATFTIEDTINPTIDTPASNETVECDGAGNTAELNAWLASNGNTGAASDVCSGVTWSNNFTTLSDDCGATGAATVTFRATDDCGNFSESTATFTIEDTINPTIDTPASNETVECDGAGNTSDLNTWLANNGGATASDTCGGVTWSNNFTTLSDDCGATGAATVTFRATDDCGNFSESTATFTIEDTINPTIDTPASNETVECDGAGNTSDLNTWLANNGGATASDTCGGVTWSNNFTTLSDDCGATGAATVTFRATDDCGNFSESTATFTIEDTINPTIDTPASNETVECDGAGNTSDLNTWLANNGGATASDTCGGVTWSNNFTTLSDDCGATGAATVTFRATDDCGNFSESTATFTIEDTTVPTIDAAASDETVECDGAGNTSDLNTWLANNGGATASDTCGGVTWSNNFTTLSDDCGATGAATVTFRATDDCGNFSESTATFTIEDTINPTIDTPASNETVECDGAGNTAELNAWLASNGNTGAASDVCSGITWSNDFTALSDDCGATGSATVTFTATDACGNASSTTATFTIEDTINPTIDTPASNETVECDGAGNTSDLNTWLANNGGATASDTCGGVTWSNNFTTLSDDCGATGAATVTFRATDDCGNFSESTATFTIEDTINPTIDTPASNETVECDGAGNTAELNAWLASNGNTGAASDVCSGITWSNDFTALSDDCGATGSATVTFTATDACGNASSTTATFTIEDTTVPTIDAAASDETVECDGAGNTSDLNTWLANNGGATASDTCGGVTWSNNFTTLSDDCGATGAATVTFRATDDCGNFSESTATFTIEDTINPTIDTPASNETVECDGAGNTAELNAWLASNGNTGAASDVCSGVTWSNDFTALSDDCGATGSATVTFTATDACGNASSTTATFTIEDTTVPTIDAAASDETVECDGAGNTSDLNTWLANNGGATASDTCGGVTWSNNFTTLSDDCGATGAATVTFRATDDCGNFSESTATFTIEDTINPTIDTPASNETVECDGAGNTSDLNTWLANNGGATASDTCGGVTWSNNFTTLSDDCGATGAATVTFRATDDCGNFSESTATFTIEDTINPTIDTPASNETVECDGAGNTSDLNTWLANNGGATASDTCGGVTWSNNFTTLSDDCGATGAATVTFRATDDCGNFSESTATFTIEDTINPTIDTPASNETVECDGSGNTTELNAWLANNGGAIASDTCGSITWSNNFTTLSDDCGATGAATVTFRATDDCGNASSTTATFTIVDTTNPDIDNTNKNDIEIECGSGDTQALLADWLDSNAGATATDNCSTITWTNDYGSDDSVQCDNGAITVIFTATDECGNRSNTSASYLIKDTDAPIINVQASDLTVECDGSGNNTDLNDWLTSNGGASSTDACSTVNWSNNFTSLSDDCGATGIATVTFTATDACGNKTDTTATFTIEDTTNPTLTVPSDVTVECTTDTSSDTTGVATGNDSCSNVTITQSDTSSVGTCGNSIVISRTWTATDECGNTTSAIQTITTEDTTPPTIDTNASNSTVKCDGSGNTTELNAWLATNGGAVASDTCGSITWSNNFSVLSDDCGETGSATVIFTATDDCGNSIETTSTFTIEDSTNPDIDNTNKNDIEIECGTGDTQALLTDWLDSNAGATATDSCSTITWTNDYGSNDAVQCDNGPITVVFTATDECGNRSITSATYLIKDTEGPNITVEASDLIVECDGTVDPSGALATWLASNGGSNATDDCSSVTWSNDFTTLSDECGATGSTTVIFTATDACGNISNSTATFTIVDTTNPTWTNIPTNQTIECDKTIDQNGVFATWLASFSGTDTCGTTTVTNNSVGLSDLCGDTGSETVIFTLTDECGNSIQQTATFTIQDTIAPELSLPPNVSAQCSDDLTPISFGEATAEDNCDPNPIITYNDVRTDGACSGTYTITRTWTATDACGNVSTADQIISTSDLSAPEFDQTDLPGNTVVECDGVPEALTLTATDNCGDAVVTVDDIITNGNCDNNYTITRTYTAMDDCGLTKTHVQTITVQDTIPPTFVESLPNANIVAECDSIPTPETLTATDVCGSAIVTVSDSRTDGTCPNSYTLTRTWTATDECGLTTSHTQNIIVQDTTAPEFVEDLPRDMTVECDDIPDVTTMSATDNCGIATVTASDIITNGDCPSNYFIARTWTATDECGLTTSHTQIITVQDTTAPVVTSTYEETLEVSCTDIPDVPALEFTDNCSSEASLIVVFNETNSFNENVFEDYQIVRTWTVRDECKNEAVFSQTLNITLDEVYSEIVAEDRCYDDGIFNLNDLISDTLNTNGIWELLEGNPDATLNGSIFDPTVLKLSSDFLPDDGGMDYRFRYTTTHEGCISITEVIMNIHADCVVLPCGENDIKISTALTPNGDGYNDSFDIMGIDLCGFVANVKIFNRWGALVYESSNYTLGSIETSGANGDWNGSAPNSSIGNKSKLPNGTYYYIIKLQNSGLSPITGPLYLGTK